MSERSYDGATSRFYSEWMNEWLFNDTPARLLQCMNENKLHWIVVAVNIVIIFMSLGGLVIWLTCSLSSYAINYVLVISLI